MVDWRKNVKECAYRHMYNIWKLNREQQKIPWLSFGSGIRQLIGTSKLGGGNLETAALRMFSTWISVASTKFALAGCMKPGSYPFMSLGFPYCCSFWKRTERDWRESQLVLARPTGQCFEEDLPFGQWEGEAQWSSPWCSWPVSKAPSALVSRLSSRRSWQRGSGWKERKEALALEMVLETFPEWDFIPSKHTGPRLVEKAAYELQGENSHFSPACNWLWKLKYPKMS